MKPEQRALVSILWPDDATVRPAMFVYATAQGFAWVEPGYVDPMASRSPVHFVDGTLTLQADGFTCEDAAGVRYVVRSIDDLEPGVDDSLRQAMDQAEQAMKDAGTTPAAERERMRAVVEAELPEPA